MLEPEILGFWFLVSLIFSILSASLLVDFGALEQNKMVICILLIIIAIGVWTLIVMMDARIIPTLLEIKEVLINGNG